MFRAMHYFHACRYIVKNMAKENKSNIVVADLINIMKYFESKIMFKLYI